MILDWESLHLLFSLMLFRYLVHLQSFFNLCQLTLVPMMPNLIPAPGVYNEPIPGQQVPPLVPGVYGLHDVAPDDEVELVLRVLLLEVAQQLDSGDHPLLAFAQLDLLVGDPDLDRAVQAVDVLVDEGVQQLEAVLG